MKRICILILAAALLTSCQQGGKRPKYVGRVNDTNITYEQYISSVRTMFEAYQLQHDEQPDEARRQILIDDAWRSIVQSVVLSDLYYDYGVMVTQQEVYDSLLANPPQIVRDSRLLQMDGEFSQALFENALRTGEPVDLDWLKQRYYNSIIPSQKLRKAVLEDIRVSDEELRREYDLRYGTAVANIAALPLKSIPEPRISQPEIRMWYDAHRDSFRIAPSCDLQWVSFPVVPSRGDTLAARALIDSIYYRLDEGERFATLAKSYSESPSSVLGGDIGYKPLEELPEKIVRQLERGLWQMHTRPYALDGGWIIYRPLKKTRNLVKLQEIIIRPKASRETLTEVLDEVRLFAELTGDLGMGEAAREFGLQMQSCSGVSSEDPVLPQLGASPRVVSNALAAKDGTLMEPMYHEPLQSYVLIQVVHSEPGGVRPLYEVTDGIAERLRAERRAQAAVEQAREIAADKEPLIAARTHGCKIIAIDDFRYTSLLLGGWREERNREILQQKPGEWVASEKTDDHAWLANIESFTSPDPAGFNAVESGLRASLVERKREGYFERWLQQQFDDAKVRDWRPTLPMFQ